MTGVLIDQANIRRSKATPAYLLQVLLGDLLPSSPASQACRCVDQAPQLRPTKAPRLKCQRIDINVAVVGPVVQVHLDGTHQKLSVWGSQRWVSCKKEAR